MRTFELKVVLLTAALASAGAAADEATAPATSPASTPDGKGPAPTPPSQPPVPASAPSGVSEPGCDEAGAERKGVQRRDFLKRRRFEVSGFGGFYAADLLSTSYAAGGSLSFYITEDLGFEALLSISEYDLNIEKPVNQLFGGQRFPNGKLAYTVLANVLWSPVHFKVRWSERGIVHGDILFALGAGDTIHDSVQGITFDVGIGLKIYPTKWLAIRFDLRDYIMVQEAIAVQRLTNNLVGTAGLSLFIPFTF